MAKTINDKKTNGIKPSYTFRATWNKDDDFKAWLIEAENSDGKGAFCIVCKIVLRPHKTDLKKHMRTTKHISNMKKPVPDPVVMMKSVSTLGGKINFGRTLSRGINTSVGAPLNFINGQRTQSRDNTEIIPVTEPATGAQLCEIRSSGVNDITAAVDAAEKAFKTWSRWSGAERGKVLTTTATKIRENLESIATLEVRDSGKPIWEARGDIAACADAFDYFGGLAGSVTGQHIPLGGQNFAIVKREPLGVCGGIGAWNFPFLIASWKIAPALACGNTMIFKPSQMTPITTTILAEILNESGLPPGAFNVLQGGTTTGRLLCEERRIAKISFTGSVPTGIQVMTSCARYIRHVTLELGGKSPLIVFEDSDLENAVKATLMANFLSQGQVCSNATRVFVHKNIYEEFVKKLVDYTINMKIGDPLKEDTKIGATITKEHGDKVLSYISQAKKDGAIVSCGGEIVKPNDSSLSGGIYLSPCILTNCHDEMTCVKEEIFGAVACILEFESEDEVLKRANKSDFGLAGGVFTKDVTRAHRVADELQCGIVWINNYNLYPPEVPFGGYKMSGIGRENGVAVMDHYTQLKTVMVEMNQVQCPLIE